MSKKFDPAPPDKYGEDPEHAEKADRAAHDKLEESLEESFPTSDPPSSTDPSKK
jgi:hypothetical protein